MKKTWNIQCIINDDNNVIFNYFLGTWLAFSVESKPESILLYSFRKTPKYAGSKKYCVKGNIRKLPTHRNAAEVLHVITKLGENLVLPDRSQYYQAKLGIPIKLQYNTVINVEYTHLRASLVTI